MNFKTILTRSVSGIIYVGIIVGCIFWGLIPFSCLVALFGTLAVIEFEKICEGINEKNLPALILDIAGVICLSLSWLVYPVLIWVLVYLCRMVMELYLNNGKPLNCLAHSLMTQIYIGLPMACLTLIGKEWGLHIVLAIFLMIWINDTGAFIVGCSIGRHKLFERLSPKKSWEGFFGGLAFNVLAGWLFAIGGKNFWGVPDWNPLSWIILGIIVTIFSTWGDLVESMFKRSFNIKDSGNLIPGHGGILDRIDSLLLVMPAALIFMIYCFMIF